LRLAGNPNSESLQWINLIVEYRIYDGDTDLAHRYVSPELLARADQVT
jgi:hypothetical protein